MKAIVVLSAFLVSSVGLAAQDKAEVVFYGNEKCPISGRKADPRFYVLHEGQKVCACSKECQKKIRENPAAAFEKAYPKDAVVDLANADCPVMGKPAKEDVTTTFQGHKVRFCCPRCKAAFAKEPNKFIAKIKHKDLKEVGNKKCPIMPEEDVVPDTYIIYKGQLIGICCDSCPEEFDADPAKFMKVLESMKKG